MVIIIESHIEYSKHFSYFVGWLNISQLELLKYITLAKNSFPTLIINVRILTHEIPDPSLG